MNKLTRLVLENFTAFEHFEQEFSPGINILIGTNGTGKTHILKVLYAACAITTGEDAEKGFCTKLIRVFNPFEGQINRLSKKSSSEESHTGVAITRSNNIELNIGISSNINITSSNISGEKWAKEALESVYVPVKEMLSHAPGFLATTAKREIAFEDVYTDIIKRAFLPKLREIPENQAKLVTTLQEAIGGKVTQKGEHFFIESERGELEFTLLAEGLRKLALLLLLIQNGTLQPESILFWDEPEANLNPALMGTVVEVILELQRFGVQVFLATHNYVLLKEFDLRKQPDDSIRYISLYRDDSGSVASHASDTYSGLHPNAIQDTFADLYKRDILRALQGGSP